jgi:hypothetical protein
MAETPRKDRGEGTSRPSAEGRPPERPPRGASGPEAESRELDDPREEEGWSQPESSAQKGALPDEG